MREWLEERFREILKTPRMWGSLEAVEMHCLLLMEAIQYYDHPNLPTRDVIDQYVQFLSGRFPGFYDNKPLHRLVTCGDQQDEPLFVACMLDFWDEQQQHAQTLATD